MLKKLSALLMILLLLPCASLAEETGYPKMIPVELTQNVTPLELNKNQKFQAAEGGFSADGMSYHDETLDVQIHKSRAYDTDIYIAYVQIAHPSQLRTQSAKPYPSDATANIIITIKPTITPARIQTSDETKLRVLSFLDKVNSLGSLSSCMQKRDFIQFPTPEKNFLIALPPLPFRAWLPPYKVRVPER